MTRRAPSLSLILLATLIACSDDPTMTPEPDMGSSLPAVLPVDAELVYGSPGHHDFQSVLRFPGVSFYGSSRAVFIEMGSQWIVHRFDDTGASVPRLGVNFGLVKGLWGTSPTNVYAVGDGAILRFGRGVVVGRSLHRCGAERDLRFLELRHLRRRAERDSPLRRRDVDERQPAGALRGVERCLGGGREHGLRRRQRRSDPARRARWLDRARQRHGIDAGRRLGNLVR